MGLFSFLSPKTAYIPGCTTYYKNKEELELYKEIFSRLGISFRILDQHICSGIEAFEAGYEQETRKIAMKNLSIFQQEGIRKIITNSPEYYKIFSINYPEMLPYWDLEVVNLWDLILENLLKKHHLILEKPMETITFHDSCHLGRHCKIYDEPRKILEILGYQIKEMDNSMGNSFCCGSCGGLNRTNKNLANKIAKERILQAKRIGVNKMVVTSLDNYNLLKANIRNTGISVLELSEVLAESLGIKKTIKEEIEDGDRILMEAKSNIRFQDELKEEEYYDDYTYQNE
ncbi:hypothetical protein CMI42_03400 [Candidatus Pacearchaeota archaeon]|nr:hypothetical protein [Candidatus Pacearchaeota archaeon]|tara:strand:+ start:2367 stop:3227 length:861 start_codon:yes stop_codon:yes gene_type:complete